MPVSAHGTSRHRVFVWFRGTMASNGAVSGARSQLLPPGPATDRY
jgi:hypothetical protein